MNKFIQDCEQHAHVGLGVVYKPLLDWLQVASICLPNSICCSPLSVRNPCPPADFDPDWVLPLVRITDSFSPQDNPGEAEGTGD